MYDRNISGWFLSDDDFLYNAEGIQFTNAGDDVVRRIKAEHAVEEVEQDKLWVHEDF